MADSKPEPSFGWLVFGKAISDTVQFLRYTARDIALGAISLLLGGVLAYLFVGKADTVREFVFIGAFTFAPAGIVMFAVFLWHLWLAPAALAYEAVKVASLRTVSDVPFKIPERKINWSIWKKLDTFTVAEMASILAKRDPAAGSSSNEEYSFKQLLLQDIWQSKLPVFERVTNSSGGPADETQVLRTAAIKWADKNGFDVSHIK